MSAAPVQAAPPIRWKALTKAQRASWIDVLSELANSERLPRRAVVALDTALDYDCGRGPIPAHVVAALERAIGDAREFLGV